MKMLWPLPVRSGRRNWARWAPVVPIIFCEPASVPYFFRWDPAKEDVERSEGANPERSRRIPSDLQEILRRLGDSDSPKLRDSNPSVVVVPGLGLFGFGKNKKEARITTEFFINAIHVMAGANALEDGEVSHPLPQARHAEQSQQFAQFHNYVALPRRKRFASSIGRWKKPSCSACPPKPNSAARSRWSRRRQRNRPRSRPAARTQRRARRRRGL